MEHKILRYFDTELRAADDGEMRAEGYPLKFDKETIIGSKTWGWREKIARTALDGAELSDVVFNFNHNDSNLLARTTNGSLRLAVDTIGLKIEARIIDTAMGRDVYKLIQSGLITRMSFAATIRESVWTMSENDEEMDAREITAIERLFDVSAVTFPAYEDTPIMARSGFGVIDAEAERRFKRRQYDDQIKRLNEILGGMRK